MFQGGDADLQSACDGFNSHCFHQKYYKIYNNLQKFTRKNALIRQLGDYNPYKVMAIGSSPIQSTISGCSLVGRTLVLGTRGRRFNSFHSDQKNALVSELEYETDLKSVALCGLRVQISLGAPKNVALV